MSAVALNPSLATPRSLESAPGSTGDPSGAFSFASVLDGIDRQDAASAAVVAPNSAAKIQDVVTADPTSSNDNPMSIEAALAALGYGSSDDAQDSPAPDAVSQGSAANVATPKQASASSRVSSPSPDGATDDASTGSGPSSIQADLAALGYGPSDGSQDAPAPTAVSSQRPAASAATPKAAAPQSQLGGMRTRPAAVAATGGSNAASSATAPTSQNVASGETTAAIEPPSTEAELAARAPGQFVASQGAASAGAVSQGSGASARPQKTVAAPPRQTGSPWPTRPSAVAASAAPVLPNSAASDPTQADAAAPQSAAGSPRRTRESFPPVGAGGSDASQAGLSAGLISQAVVSQAGLPAGVISQAVVSQAVVSQAVVSQAVVSQPVVSQAVVSQAAASQAVASQDLGAAAPKAATVAAAQVADAPLPRTDSSAVAFSGATDIGAPLFPDTSAAASYAAAANPLTADPSLGLRSLQSRTHLAMTNALPVRINGTAGRATASAVAAPVSASAASAAATAAALDANSSGGGRQTSDERPPSAASIPRVDTQKTDAIAASSLDPSLSVAGAGLDPGSNGLALPLSGLAGFVADQASSLSTQARPTAAAQTSSLQAPQSVKELEISLDPANLGALSVKMRLANGKLSVVIGVANSSTLAAIQGEREAIVGRLGMGPLPLENLVITSGTSSQEFAQSAPGGNDASDAADPRQARSNDNSAGSQRGDGGTSRGRSAPSAGSGSIGSAPGGRAGVLLV